MYKYSEMTGSYKEDRIKGFFKILDEGGYLEIRGLFLEEIKILKAIYGKELIKTGGIIQRAMESEAF